MSFYHRRGGDETHSRDGCVPIISPQIFREYFLPDMSVLLLGCKLEQSVKCILVLVLGLVAGPRRSGHQTPFNLYQDLLCIKLVGFCVDQEERGSVRRHHPLGLGEALHYQRVHARHLREYRPGHGNN